MHTKVLEMQVLTAFQNGIDFYCKLQISLLREEKAQSSYHGEAKETKD